jgi:hypothetical protein
MTEPCVRPAGEFRAQAARQRSALARGDPEEACDATAGEPAAGGLAHRRRPFQDETASGCGRNDGRSGLGRPDCPGDIRNISAGDDRVNEENTHAEDRLAALVHQLAILTFNETGSIPPMIEIPWFFVSASPCTSRGGTSTKGGPGCTENLINWYQNGLVVYQSPECGQLKVKVKIQELHVNHLYKSNSYDGADASLAALVRLKDSGAVGEWSIDHAPSLNKVYPLSSQT